MTSMLWASAGTTGKPAYVELGEACTISKIFCSFIWMIRKLILITDNNLKSTICILKMLSEYFEYLSLNVGSLHARRDWRR